MRNRTGLPIARVAMIQSIAIAFDERIVVVTHRTYVCLTRISKMCDSSNKKIFTKEYAQQQCIEDR